MSEQEMTKNLIICLMSKPSQSYKAKKKLLQKKRFLRERESGGLNKKQKEGFLIALTTAIKKDPTTSIRKHANELIVQKKTGRTAIKQDLSPDFNPIDFTIWGI